MWSSIISITEKYPIIEEKWLSGIVIGIGFSETRYTWNSICGDMYFTLKSVLPVFYMFFFVLRQNNT